MTRAGARAAARLRPVALSWPLGAALALLAGTAALFAALLWRFPFAGLYGQDSYAYYYQALAFWRQWTGQPPLAGALFGTDGLQHWPIGYHLHLVAGFLLAGPVLAGGRAVTLLLAILTPALLVPLAGALWPQATSRPRAVAGLMAGASLVLTGTYTRTATAVMADVPALFWSLLGVLCVLRAWPPYGREPAGAGAHGRVWAAAAGLALGLATLTRFGAALNFGLWLVACGLWVYATRRPLATTPPDLAGHAPPAASPPGPTGDPQSARHNPNSKIVWFVVGVGLALLPEAAYLLTHPGGSDAAGWLSAWSPANLVRRTVSSGDGTSTFGQPMGVFYLGFPWADATDFLAPACLPAALLGLGVLIRQRGWPTLALLGAWWLGPALFFGGSPYQAQRFVLAYLPALTLLVGIGGATAVESAVRTLRARTALSTAPAGRLGAGVILLALALGAWQGWGAARAWAATQAGWQAGEQAVAALAQRAAGPAPPAPPRVVAFGITAALYHYTGWPLAELYIDDEAAITRFWQVPGRRLVVVPAASLATQWVGTPLATRWAWLQTHYTLLAQGQAAGYTVFTVEGNR